MATGRPLHTADLPAAKALLDEWSAAPKRNPIAIRSSPTYFGLGKLDARIGKREQAHEHLSTATTMYREIGMTYWLERAEREDERFWMRVCSESLEE